MCKLAEGKSWDATRQEYRQTIAEINEKGLEDYFKGFWHDNGSYSSAQYENLKNDAVRKCDNKKTSQGDQGLCIQSLIRLRAAINAIPYSEITTPAQRVEERQQKQKDEEQKELEKREYEAEVKAEYEKSFSLVKPYIDALQLLGKPYHPNFSKTITDRLLVSFSIEDSGIKRGSSLIAIQAQISGKARVRMDDIYFNSN